MSVPNPNEIRRVALEIFVKKGYRRATMGDIAHAVGMSRPALYLVFPNKEMIFRSVLELYFDEALAQVEDELRRPSALTERLVAALEVWSARTYDIFKGPSEIQEPLDAPPEFARALLVQAQDRLVLSIADLLRESTSSPLVGPRVDARARILLAAGAGLKTVTDDVDQARKLARQLVELVVLGIAAQEPALESRVEVRG